MVLDNIYLCLLFYKYFWFQFFLKLKNILNPVSSLSILRNLYLKIFKIDLKKD
jgi:hypothetical protein